MNTAHVLRVLGLELRRVRAAWIRLFLSTVVVAVAFALAGHASRENLSAIAVGTTLGYVLVGPIALFRDKLEGTLEFLRFLPTSPVNIAAAKLAAAAIMVLPASIQAAIGFMLLWAGRWPVSAAALFVVAWLLSWVVLVAASWFAIALTARFEPESLVGGPVAVLVLLVFGVSQAIERFVPHPGESLQAFAMRPNAPVLVVLGGVAICVAVGVLSFITTRDGVVRYRAPRLG